MRTDIKNKYHEYFLFRSYLILLVAILLAVAIFTVNHTIIFSNDFILEEKWLQLMTFNSPFLAIFCFLIKQSGDFQKHPLHDDQKSTTNGNQP